MPTQKQRRDAARRHLERQLQRRQERAARQRRITLIASVAGTLVIIGVVLALVFALGGSDNKNTASSPGHGATRTSKPPTQPTSTAATSTAPTSTFVAKKTTGACGYQTVDPSSNPALKDVGLPPDPKVTPKSDLVVSFQTNRGTITANLDGRHAPCNVQALSYLIHKGFFNDTPCPRVVDSGIYVVQCGSGGTSTAGGPTFTSPDENTKNADYSAGAIAMANIGQPNTGSSQFFFITKDSNAGLAKSYSLIGHVTSGLNILQQVAAGGNDGSSGSVGGGAPKLNLTFKKVTVTKVVGGGKDPGLGPKPTLKPVS